MSHIRQQSDLVSIINEISSFFMNLYRLNRLINTLRNPFLIYTNQLISIGCVRKTIMSLLSAVFFLL